MVMFLFSHARDALFQDIVLELHVQDKTGTLFLRNY